MSLVPENKEPYPIEAFVPKEEIKPKKPKAKKAKLFPSLKVESKVLIKAAERTKLRPQIKTAEKLNFKTAKPLQTLDLRPQIKTAEKPKSKALIKTVENQCEICNNKLPIGSKSNAKYCSKKCKNKAYYNRKKS